LPPTPQEIIDLSFANVVADLIWHSPIDLSVAYPIPDSEKSLSMLYEFIPK
jgi:hypothetical protein